MALRNSMRKFKSVPAPTTGPALEGEFVLPSDTSRPARVGLLVLGIGFGGFLLWAGFAPLDEGVPTQGIVAIDTKRKAVQHMTGGLVREVFVKEGQFVKKDEPLIRLDDALVRANFEAVRQHYYTLRAMEGRLAAEQSGQSRIIFHTDLQHQGDPLLNQTLDNQKKLFLSRRMALAADMQATAASIQGQRASIQGYEGMLKARNRQSDYLKEELKGVRELVMEGYASRNKQLELERLAAESMGSIADLQGNILRVRSTTDETRLRSIQRIQEYQKEVGSSLSDVRREVQADEEKFKAATQEMARTIIRAPAEGQVVGLSEQTVGGVIGPGQKLMDIVPQNEQLILETSVPPRMIDSIHLGLPTDVRFSAFSSSPALVVKGKVESISSDLIIDPKTNQTYYLGRISITPEGLKQLGSHQMQAGMPVEVVIKTGERTVLNYLLHPFLKRMAASLKES